jgi:hypothetical protein
VFRMIDLDKKTKTFLLSFESLHRSGGEEARMEFARRGGYFGQGIRTRQCFADFCNAIAARSKHLPRVTLAKTPGWLRLANGTYVYVLPDVTIGQAAEQVILEHAEDAGEEYGTSGTAEEWRNRVGRFCIENTRLLLAASVPFTSPLLDVMKEEGGGLNLLGTSSVGKSAMLRVAGSVLGGPQSVKTMDATATGLELAATLVNDSTLLLDELGAGKADEVGQAIYRLANGISKARGTSNVGLRAQRSWRVLFLTNGERDLKSLVTEAGKRFFAGQEVRHPNIEAEVSQESGIYNQFHGLADGAKLTAHLRAECQACFGSPFREFLKRLVEDRLIILILLSDYFDETPRKQVLASGALMLTRFGSNGSSWFPFFQPVTIVMGCQQAAVVLDDLLHQLHHLRAVLRPSACDRSLVIVCSPFQNSSVDARRTCSAVTTCDFSLVAATRAPRARWLALRNRPPEPWWMAVIACASKGECLSPAIFR